jgi:hypothetical protein
MSGVDGVKATRADNITQLKLCSKEKKKRYHTTLYEMNCTRNMKIPTFIYTTLESSMLYQKYTHSVPFCEYALSSSLRGASF